MDKRKAGLLAALLLMLAGTLSVIGSTLFVEAEVLVVREHLPEQPGSDQYGWVGASIGDLNGDGAAEYIISAPSFSGTAAQQGRAYVYSGLDGSLMATHTGETNDWLGYSTAPAGDIDHDGVPDYMISAPQIAIIFGGSDEARGHVRVYSGADHSVLLDLADPRESSFFGADVAGVGDLNGDGTDDLLVGAELYGPGLDSPATVRKGRVTLFSGGDGSVIWHRDGNPGDWMGGGVGLVGDVNDDGSGDVAASARRANAGEGRVYILSGTNGQTLRTLAPTLPSNSFTFGRFFADGAGDVNGDGTADVFVGDYNALGGNGRVYLFSGAAGAPLLHLFEAEAPFDGLGPGRGVGDVNGDGHADLLVAAWQSSEAVPAGGKAYLRSGADGSILNTATGTTPGIFLGVDALPLGDVNQDGRADYLITGYSAPSYVISFE